MTIRSLEIFVAVADCKTMQKAAESLYISQPSVSQTITELEKHYNTKLFERISQRLYITDDGKYLLPYARHIVDSFKNIEKLMLSRGNALKIGASVSVGTCMLTPIINKLEALTPDIDITVTVNNTSEIERLITVSELDIAIVEGYVESLDIIKVPLCQDELVIVAGKAHPFYNKNNLCAQDLQGQILIAREAGSVDRNQFEIFLSQHNITTVKKWSCTNTETIKNAVKNGNGLAIISKMLVSNEVANDEIKILKFKDICMTRDIQLIYHKNKYLSSQMKLCCEVCKSLYN